MKQFQINKAFSVLNKLANAEMPVREAYQIYMITEKIKPAYQFEFEREKKLIEKYSGTFEQGTGTITFEKTESAEAFRKEMAELNELDVELDFEPVTVSIDALAEHRMTPADIVCLEGFVELV